MHPTRNGLLVAEPGRFQPRHVPYSGFGFPWAGSLRTLSPARNVPKPRACAADATVLEAVTASTDIVDEGCIGCKACASPAGASLPSTSAISASSTSSKIGGVPARRRTKRLGSRGRLRAKLISIPRARTIFRATRTNASRSASRCCVRWWIGLTPGSSSSSS